MVLMLIPIVVLTVIVIGQMVMLSAKNETINMLSYERNSLQTALSRIPATGPQGAMGPSGRSHLHATLAKDEPRLRETVAGLVDNGFWTEDEAHAFFKACGLDPVAASNAADDVCPECGDLFASSDDYLCPNCRKRVDG
jgi:hypothetical protein